MLDQTDIQRGRTWYLRKAAPLHLSPVPDNWTNAAATSPIWAPTTSALGLRLYWRAVDTTHNWARVSFPLPAGCSPLTPILVQGLIIGTATAESIIIKTYKASLAAGDGSTFDTSNATEQASISIAATYQWVTLASITPVAAGDVIALAFRPRTVADANCVQDKWIEGVRALW
jgi:hypothetical protein